MREQIFSHIRSRMIQSPWQGSSPCFYTIACKKRLLCIKFHETTALGVKTSHPLDILSLCCQENYLIFERLENPETASQG